MIDLVVKPGGQPLICRVFTGVALFHLLDNGDGEVTLEDCNGSVVPMLMVNLWKSSFDSLLTCLPLAMGSDWYV